MQHPIPSLFRMACIPSISCAWSRLPVRSTSWRDPWMQSRLPSITGCGNAGGHSSTRVRSGTRCPWPYLTREGRRSLFFWMKKKENSSSCTGWNKKSRELILLIAGVALTLSAIFLARQRILAAESDIQRKVAPVYIVVPAVPIPAGAVFSERNLSRKSVPSAGISSRNVPASEFELLIGARAKGNLAAGEPILWTDVEEPFDAENFSSTIPTGRRAFTFQASFASSFAGLIRPGDCVDLLCEGETANAVQKWFLAIPVISVDRNYRRPPASEESREVSTLTVSVTPEEGRYLSRFARIGHIHWFLRNPDEPDKPASSPASSARRSSEKVEIWKGGVQETNPTFPNGESG
ncbi:MAG: Flp pilus assembly protein CpaB [Deltaproteobacteria bacterium]|nr:MAG: Flp pilus assembly protein CpaB [Deltaproteobacteria bacterium]